MDLQAIERLKKKSEELKDGSWGLYQEAMKFALPNESTVGSDNALKKADELYDSTVMIENNKLARKQVNMILPTNIQWGGLKTDMQDVNSQQTETLQAYGDNIYKVLINSNLNKEALGFFLNLGIGTACIKMTYTGDNRRPIEFLNIPLPNFSFLEGINGKILHTFVTTENLRYDQIVSMFPDGNVGSLTEDGTYKIIESVVPSEDKKKKGFSYVVTVNGMSELIYETEIDYNPFVVCRTLKTGNSIWGNGVVINILANATNLNNSKYLKRVMGKATIKPALAYEGDPKQMKRFNIELGKMFYLGARGQNAINPVNLMGNANVELMNIQDDMQQIREGMFSSYISQMEGVQPRTAYEWQQRNSEFLEVFSANYNMIEEEMLIPIFMNTLLILAKLNYNQMDDTIINDDTVVPVFYNKLTENYKQEKIDNFNRLINNLIQVGGTPQFALGLMNVPQSVSNLTNWYDVDFSMFKDEKEMEQFLQGYLQQFMGGGQQ
jgi:hypothetical protein